MNEKIRSEIQQPRWNITFPGILAGFFMGLATATVAVCAMMPPKTATCIMQPIAAEPTVAPAAEPVIWQILVPPSAGWRMIEVWSKTLAVFDICPPPATLVPTEPVVPGLNFSSGEDLHPVLPEYRRIPPPVQRWR